MNVRSLSLFLLVAMLFAGCSSEPSSPGSTGTPGVSGETPGSTTQKPKIALIMKSLANEFFATMAKGMRLMLPRMAISTNWL